MSRAPTLPSDLIDGNYVRGKNSQKTRNSSQAEPIHQSHTRRVNLLVSSFTVTKEANLIQSTTAVSEAGYSLETYQMGSPP